MAINAAVAAGTSKKDLAILSALSGAYYYLYNEVAFLALGRVNPVTHAVGNTIKRVVIIIASVNAFNTPISRLGVIGSSIAITGTPLALAKNARAASVDGARAARAPSFHGSVAHRNTGRVSWSRTPAPRVTRRTIKLSAPPASSREEREDQPERQCRRRGRWTKRWRRLVLVESSRSHWPRARP